MIFVTRAFVTIIVIRQDPRPSTGMASKSNSSGEILHFEVPLEAAFTPDGASLFRESQPTRW